MIGALQWDELWKGHYSRRSYDRDITVCRAMVGILQWEEL